MCPVPRMGYSKNDNKLVLYSSYSGATIIVQIVYTTKWTFKEHLLSWIYIVCTQPKMIHSFLSPFGLLLYKGWPKKSDTMMSTTHYSVCTVAAEFIAKRISSIILRFLVNTQTKTHFVTIRITTTLQLLQ